MGTGLLKYPGMYVTDTDEAQPPHDSAQIKRPNPERTD